MSEKKLIGEVIWFKDDKGFGFIFSGGLEYFAHRNQIRREEKTLTAGKRVSFTPEKAEKGWAANNITDVGE